MITDRIDTTNDPIEALTRVGQEEARRILGLLDDAIVQSRRSRRKIERNLGWSQGYLGSVLRGRIGLKVWHVFALSRELRIEPLSLFLTAAPPRDPSWILEQLGIEPAPAKPAEEPPPVEVVSEPLPATLEELEDLVQKLLRDELARLGLLDESEPS